MIAPESKMLAPDRVLKLELINTTNSKAGMVDPNLFKENGGNQLHAMMDPETCLWTFKYEKGAVPMALRGSYTGFRALKKFAENYFAQNNVRITEVK